MKIKNDIKIAAKFGNPITKKKKKNRAILYRDFSWAREIIHDIEL